MQFGVSECNLEFDVNNGKNCDSEYKMDFEMR